MYKSFQSEHKMESTSVENGLSASPRASPRHKQSIKDKHQIKDEQLNCNNNNNNDVLANNNDPNQQTFENKHDDSLYSPSLLNDMMHECGSTLLPLPQDLHMRPLHLSDFDKNFPTLLSQLTDVGQPTQQEYEAQFRSMQSCQPLLFYVTVIENLNTNQIVAAATLVLELKFIHSMGHRGRIEDVVVDESMRGKQLGKILLERLTLLGERLGCYKMSLECKDHLIRFYEKFGYKVDEGNNFMVKRFDQR